MIKNFFSLAIAGMEIKRSDDYFEPKLTYFISKNIRRELSLTRTINSIEETDDV